MALIDDVIAYTN